MALFSQRSGIRPLQKAIQRESIDDDLKNKLWSALKLCIWDKYQTPNMYSGESWESGRVMDLVQQIWLNQFNAPIDTIPDFHGHKRSAYNIIRENFYKFEWWQTYDFLEFVVKLTVDPWSLSLIELCNTFFNIENSAYRFVGNEIAEITSEHEIKAIESALGSSTRSATAHFQRALELLSDRQNPDYRNSIKESISAVEAICQLIGGNTKATLGEALKAAQKKAPIHPALEAAFNKLYGYTSDSGGIRHALTEGTSQPTFAEAKFMLVACSAFNGFLLAKAAENGIKV